MVKKADFVKILKTGGIGVLPTDTVYGLVGLALLPETVTRIYKVRRRTPTKPLIILISKIADLKKFGIELSPEQKNFLAKNWFISPEQGRGGPGPVSIILPLPKANWVKFKYLHRGTKALAFRLPADNASHNHADKPSSQPLLKMLASTGPLVAPSANPEGLPTAKNITEAKKYFGDKVNFYLAGRTKTKPSTLVKIDKNGRIEVIRK